MCVCIFKFSYSKDHFIMEIIPLVDSLVVNAHSMEVKNSNVEIHPTQKVNMNK